MVRTWGLPVFPRLVPCSPRGASLVVWRGRGIKSRLGRYPGKIRNVIAVSWRVGGAGQHLFGSVAAVCAPIRARLGSESDWISRKPVSLFPDISSRPISAISRA